MDETIYTPHPLGAVYRLYAEVAVVHPSGQVHRIHGCQHHIEQYIEANRAAGDDATYWLFHDGVGGESHFCAPCRHLEQNSQHPQAVWLSLQRSTYADRP